MKHIATSITIVGIWLIATFTILKRDDAQPMTILFYALANTIILGIFGFTAVKHPDEDSEEELSKRE